MRPSVHGPGHWRILPRRGSRRVKRAIDRMDHLQPVRYGVGDLTGVRSLARGSGTRALVSKNQGGSTEPHKRTSPNRTHTMYELACYLSFQVNVTWVYPTQGQLGPNATIKLTVCVECGGGKLLAPRVRCGELGDKPVLKRPTSEADSNRSRIRPLTHWAERSHQQDIRIHAFRPLRSSYDLLFHRRAHSQRGYIKLPTTSLRKFDLSLSSRVNTGQTLGPRATYLYVLATRPSPLDNVIGAIVVQVNPQRHADDVNSTLGEAVNTTRTTQQKSTLPVQRPPGKPGRGTRRWGEWKECNDNRTIVQMKWILVGSNADLPSVELWIRERQSTHEG